MKTTTLISAIALSLICTTFVTAQTNTSNKDKVKTETKQDSSIKREYVSISTLRR